MQKAKLHIKMQNAIANPNEVRMWQSLICEWSRLLRFARNDTKCHFLIFICHFDF